MGPAARGADGQAAVSSVVGTVLMLGITITVFAGFSLFVLEEFSEQSDSLRADLEVLQEDDRYVLQHNGGEPLDLAKGRLVVTLGGVQEEVPLTDLAAQTADGLTWRIGEALCVSGPAPCHYDHEEVESLRLVYGNAIVLSESDAGGPASATTFVTGSTVVTGSIGSFAAAQSSRDSNVEASLLEEAVLVPAGAATGTFSGSATDSNFATSPNNALAGTLSGDGTAARAILSDTGDWVEVTGFTLPASATAVTSVTLGFEGSSASTTGSLPQVRLSYYLVADDPAPGATSLVQSLTSTTDAQFTRSVTADQATWTIDEVETMSVRVEIVNNPNRDARIDHIYVTLGYDTAATTVYELEVELSVSGVPDRDLHTLQLDYRVLGDSFTVKLWDADAAQFVQRGTLSADSSTGWSWTLTEAEYNGGAPRLLFEDVAAGGTQGTLFLDYVRVVSS
jgi:hypothetical protein